MTDEICLSLDTRHVGWVVAIGCIGLWLCFFPLLGWFGLFVFKTRTGIQDRDVCDTVFVVSVCKISFFLEVTKNLYSKFCILK